MLPRTFFPRGCFINTQSSLACRLVPQQIVPASSKPGTALRIIVSYFASAVYGWTGCRARNKYKWGTKSYYSQPAQKKVLIKHYSHSGLVNGKNRDPDDYIEIQAMETTGGYSGADRSSRSQQRDRWKNRSLCMPISMRKLESSHSCRGLSWKRTVYLLFKIDCTCKGCCAKGTVLGASPTGRILRGNELRQGAATPLSLVPPVISVSEYYGLSQWLSVGRAHPWSYISAIPLRANAAHYM